MKKLILLTSLTLLSSVYAQDTLDLYKAKNQEQSVKLKQVKEKQRLIAMNSQQQQYAMQIAKQQQEEIAAQERKKIFTGIPEQEGYGSQFLSK